MKVHEGLPPGIHSTIKYILGKDTDIVNELKALAESNDYSHNIQRVIQSELQLRNITKHNYPTSRTLEDLKCLDTLTPTFKTHIQKAIDHYTRILEG